MWLTKISVKNPYFAAVLALAMIVLGLFAINKLPIEAYPDIRFPVAVVQTVYRGASPSVVESDVTKPIEEAVNTINGVKRIRSYSFEGLSFVIIEFTLKTPVATAVQDVRDKVGQVAGTFRREISTPIVSQFSATDNPMLTATFSSKKMTLPELSDWLENTLKKRLQVITGVGDVQLVGTTEREIHIYLKPNAMQSLGVSVGQISQAISQANQDFPSGSIMRGNDELSVRLTGRLKTPADFANVVISQRNGTLIRVGDVATVEDGIATPNSIATLNGEPAVTVDVRAVRGANIVDVGTAVKEEIAQTIASTGNDIHVFYIVDDSINIRHSVDEVSKTLIEGVVLTVLIVFLFLGTWRSTVITGLILPISLIGTMFAISLMGFTINLMTLMALSLSIGLLIDDAIVVRENIVRHMHMGQSHMDAALNGTKEIGMAVLATSLSIVAVFFPIGYMDGIIGKFFHQFGLTVAVAVFISTIVSLSLDPMLSSIWYDPGREGKRSLIGHMTDRFDKWLEHMALRYTQILAWALRHRFITMLTCLILTIASFALVPLGYVGGEFMPQEDRGKISIQLETPVGSELGYTAQKTTLAESLLKPIKEVKYVEASVGASGFSASKNDSHLVLDIGDKNERSRNIDQVIQDIRQRLSVMAGVKVVSVSPMKQSTGPGKPINISVRGDNITKLRQVTNELYSKLEKIPGVSDLKNTDSDAVPSVVVSLNRDAGQSLGVNLEQVGSTLQTLFAGKTVTQWEAPNGNNYDVRLRLPESKRTQNALNQVQIPVAKPNGQVALVPLSSIATIHSGSRPKQINRIDLQREINITGNISGRSSSAVFADIAKAKASIHLPKGISFLETGQSKNMQESLGYAGQALFLGIAFIYMILAAQFRSFTLPITIMMALPLIFIGVFVSLWITHNTLNMFSVIGIVMLMGLAAKNGILLVDFINHARLNQNMGRTEAIIEAGRVRLRPIIMTSLAMIFGMLPIALSTGIGSESREPMAVAIIGGLITSTLLTLLIVPIVYTIMDNVRGKIHYFIHRLNGTPEEHR